MGSKVIILIVIILAIVAVAQLLKMYDAIVAVRGKREEDVDLKTNNLNATLFIVFMVVFFGSFFYLISEYGRGRMPVAASEHGVEIDWLYGINWVIVFTVYLLTNALLFIFAFRYRYKPGVKAFYYPHNNKLEMIWTVIPAAALAVIIILGLMTWNNIMGKASDDAVVVEIYAKQFDFTARYSGDDNKLGYSDYKLISNYADNSNPLGVVTQNNMDWRIFEIQQGILEADSLLKAVDEGKAILSKANYLKRVKESEKMARIETRIWNMKERFGDSVTVLANDDFYTKTQLFLVEDQEYSFVFRSQDVIHSAYFPHFRAQMNCVPGQRTTFKFKPTMTTAEMRKETNNPEFNYILLCNKICGKSHSMMNMPVYVGTQEEFDAWSDLEAGNVKPIVAADSLLVAAPHIVKPVVEESTNDHGGHH